MRPAPRDRQPRIGRCRRRPRDGSRARDVKAFERRMQPFAGVALVGIVVELFLLRQSQRHAAEEAIRALAQRLHGAGAQRDRQRTHGLRQRSRRRAHGHLALRQLHVALDQRAAPRAVVAPAAGARSRGWPTATRRHRRAGATRPRAASAAAAGTTPQRGAAWPSVRASPGFAAGSRRATRGRAAAARAAVRPRLASLRPRTHARSRATAA